MTGWDFATFLDVAAARWPERIAVVNGTRRTSWSELASRAGALAATWHSAGLRPGDVVTPYLRNVPEHVEVLWATMGSALVPMNTNYRYLDDELVEIWNDAQVRVVVYAEEFRDRVDRVRDRARSVRLWVEVGSSPTPAWARAYESIVAGGCLWEPAEVDRESSLVLIYTGGTTGRPKGVMWRQGDLLSLLNTQARRPLPDRADRAEIELAVSQLSRPLVSLVANPLMHGAGLFALLGCLSNAGTAVLPSGRRLDAVALLDDVDAEGVVTMSIVGDAFARPLLDALDADPGRWSLTSLRAVFSSGAALSRPIKERLLAYAPRARIVDGLGSSEAFGVASAESVPGAISDDSSFRPSSRTAVVLDDGTFALPGEARIGRLAMSGWLPQGYLGDPAKTAEVFLEIDGTRWSVPGDMAQLTPEGRIRLLGRGSACINTGGEKVFVEEVEEALKAQMGVLDAAVLGLDDPQLGQQVVALVEVRQPSPGVDEVLGGARRALAGYKVPRRLAVVDSIERGPNGKLDYRRLAERARDLWPAVQGPR